jgi:hypothetical protein
MAITITPNIQPVSASASTPSAPAAGIVLQAGQVITAEVVQVLANDQVQIAIGNQTIEAATQVPLQAGQTLQLQVSQTSSGIGLAIVNQPSTGTGQAGAGTAATSNSVITLSPSLAASLAANLTPDAVTPTSLLSQIEISAVSVAAQTAATEQTSLAPLFADLNVASGLPNLPPQVQQAVVQVLAQQTNLDRNLTADTVKQAFQSSGIFLEASLASGSASNGVPDLKAALIVLRQALISSLSDVTAAGATSGTAVPASVSSSQPGAPPTAPAAEGTPPSGATPSDPASTGSIPAPATTGAALQGTTLSAATPVQAVELAAEADVLLAAVPAELAALEVPAGAPSIVLPTGTAAAAVTASAQSPTPGIVQEVLELAAGAQTSTPNAVPADAAARAAASGAALNLLQEVLQASPLAITNPSQFVT